MSDNDAAVSVRAEEASDAWGFVGVIVVRDIEAYRTIRRYSSPADAVAATRHLLASTLGGLLAGHEWRIAANEFGHAPRRTELGFGLGGHLYDTNGRPTAGS